MTHIINHGRAGRWAKSACVALVLFILLPLAACTQSSYRSVTVFAMDTTVSIQIAASHKDADEVLNYCEQLLYRLDGLLSRSRKGSDVWRINHGLVTSGLDAHTVAVLDAALRMSDSTSGAFDITVAPLIELWEACSDAGRMPGDDELSAALSFVGYSQLTLDGDTLTKSCEGVKIDLGGIAKGYAADVIAEYLESQNVAYGIVSFGSCIAVVGSKPDGSPFRIAIRDPGNMSRVAGYVTMRDGVLSVTGDYERYYEIQGEKYHHVLSPYTGYSAPAVWHSVAVVCGSGIIADALSTALFVSGDYESVYGVWRSTDLEFEGVFIGDGGTYVSAGMAGNYQPAQ